MTRRMSLLLCASIGLLLLASPSPATAVSALTHPGPGRPVTDAVVGLVALAAWLLVLWLAGTAVLTLGSHLDGPLGTGCSAALQRVAPVAVRRVVALALGIGVVLASAGPAQAGPTAAGLGNQPAQPGSAPAGVSRMFDWPTTAAPIGTAGGPAQGGSVVVQAGDSLWRLAAAHLPAAATTSEVAVAWPAWWSANRAVIGDDPGLLHPGQHLTVPDLPPTSPRPMTPGVQP